MSIHLKGKTSVPSLDRDKPEWEDTSRDQRETTVNGYTFHWGINETRNFLDDGVGRAHVDFKAGGDACTQNFMPFESELS